MCFLITFCSFFMKTSDVRWLSHGESLSRLYVLRNAVKQLVFGKRKSIFIILLTYNTTHTHTHRHVFPSIMWNVFIKMRLKGGDNTNTQSIGFPSKLNVGCLWPLKGFSYFLMGWSSLFVVFTFLWVKLYKRKHLFFCWSATQQRKTTLFMWWSTTALSQTALPNLCTHTHTQESIFSPFHAKCRSNRRDCNPVKHVFSLILIV